MVFPYLVLVALAYRIDAGDVADVVSKVLGFVRIFCCTLDDLAQLADQDTWQLSHLAQLFLGQSASLKYKLSLTNVLG